MSEVFYARIKPYNPKRGHVVQRYHVVGRAWKGGDGIYEIPEWVKVNRAQAEQLLTCYQTDAYSPMVFDICTPDLRAQVDAREEADRLVIRGQRAVINELPNVAAAVRELTGPPKPNLDALASGMGAQIGGLDVPVHTVASDTKAKTTDISGTDKPAPAPAPVAAPAPEYTAPSTFSERPSVAGRADAAAGLPEPSAPVAEVKKGRYSRRGK